jgi:hypothetical protein
MSDWIECNLPWDKRNDVNSFVGMKLNKPGVLVEVTLLDDDEKHQFLIGHINKNRGICDDCTAFDEFETVLRYKIVWEENEPAQTT